LCLKDNILYEDGGANYWLRGHDRPLNLIRIIPA